MHQQTYSPDLTAATTTVRALLAAGWRYDSTSPMADDTTIRTLLHPTGREIHARTDNDGWGGSELTDLTMTGLTLEQVAGAIAGAGLAPAAPTAPTEPDLRHRLAAELHRFADDIVRLELPIGSDTVLRFGVVDSRADLERWADYLSSTVTKDDSNGIPFVQARINLGDTSYGPQLAVGVQSPKEESEAEVLRARVAELEAQIAGGAALDRVDVAQEHRAALDRANSAAAGFDVETIAQGILCGEVTIRDANAALPRSFDLINTPLVQRAIAEAEAESGAR